MSGWFQRWRGIVGEIRSLRREPRKACDPSRLRLLDGPRLESVLREREAAAAWCKWFERCEESWPPGDSGAVNPGDRRALFTLTLALRPKRILEIGTHLGASTLAFAAALEELDEGGMMTTVDVVDVNDEDLEHWRQFGAPFSPAGALKRSGLTRRVRFVQETALEFLTRTSEDSYDLILLDGDHGATAVYREIPAALRVLCHGGTVVLHDYYPNAKPLWPGEMVVPGPFLASARLRRQGAGFAVLPLGALPWPTKLSSCVTSLAVLT